MEHPDDRVVCSLRKQNFEGLINNMGAQHWVDTGYGALHLHQHAPTSKFCQHEVTATERSLGQHVTQNNPECSTRPTTVQTPARRCGAAVGSAARGEVAPLPSLHLHVDLQPLSQVQSEESN